MSNSSTSPPRRVPPHIRLNSAQSDLLTKESFNDRPEGPVQKVSSRTLIPQSAPMASSARSKPSTQRLYNNDDDNNNNNNVSTERLLPPSRSRSNRFRDRDSPGQSPVQSAFSSRRTSWSSEGAASRDSRNYSSNPFDDPRAPSRAGSDDDNLNTQTVSEKYNILPSAGLLLFPEDVEKDDWLHNPDPNEKEKRECDIFSRRGIVNVGGLAFMTIGLLVLFIAYPILTFVKPLVDPSDPCATDPTCIDVGDVPLLKNIRTGLIDPDTPSSAMTKRSATGKTLNLVFSDEFNTPNRTFYPGDDPYFTAVDLWYGVTLDLEWYDPDAVTTGDGVLEIRFDAFQNHNLNYRSGMVQSWNQMCFSGGHLEAAISLPGAGDTMGFWPGFWAMGNLGRPGYAATTDGLWPYSYENKCDAGITKNQSSTDGISSLPGMRLPACTCEGEDHPTPGISRSAPEIDVIEASNVYLGPGESAAIGSASQSFQLAPFDIWYQPNAEFIEVFDRSITMINAYRGGVYQQALSSLTNLANDWYNGQEYQTYAFEYTPGSQGDIYWYVADQETWHLDARAVGPNGNIGQRVIPMEPMAIVMNFGMSPSFSALNLTGIATLLPATMRFDYIRIYQDPSSDESVSCDPPGYATTEYIANHQNAYSNPNLTLWDQTSHSWPRNTLVDGCSAS